jgi:hypothetical protein
MSAETEIDPRLTGKVTFALDNVPVREALDQVCAAGGCTWTLEDGKLRFVAKK